MDKYEEKSKTKYPLLSGVKSRHAKLSSIDKPDFFTWEQHYTHLAILHIASVKYIKFIETTFFGIDQKHDDLKKYVDYMSSIRNYGAFDIFYDRLKCKLAKHHELDMIISLPITDDYTFLSELSYRELEEYVLYEKSLIKEPVKPESPLMIKVNDKVWFTSYKDFDDVQSNLTRENHETHPNVECDNLVYHKQITNYKRQIKQLADKLQTPEMSQYQSFIILYNLELNTVEIAIDLIGEKRYYLADKIFGTMDDTPANKSNIGKLCTQRALSENDIGYIMYILPRGIEPNYEQIIRDMKFCGIIFDVLSCYRCLPPYDYISKIFDHVLCEFRKEEHLWWGINNTPVRTLNDLRNDIYTIYHNADMLPKKIQIFVKTLTGKTITLHIDDNSSVDQLFELISKKENIPEEQMRLVYGGKQLEIGRDIREYYIMRESTIHLICRLRGC